MGSSNRRPSRPQQAGSNSNTQARDERNAQGTDEGDERNDITGFLKEHGGTLGLILILIPIAISLTRILFMARGSRDTLLVLSHRLDLPALAYASFINSFPTMFIIVAMILIAATHTSPWGNSVRGVFLGLAVVVLPPVSAFIFTALGFSQTIATRLRYSSQTPALLRILIGSLISGALVLTVTTNNALPVEAIKIGQEPEAAVFVANADDHQITFLYPDGRVRLANPNEIISRRLCSLDESNPWDAVLLMPTLDFAKSLIQTGDIQKITPTPMARCPSS
ncbi:hypothetical protein [Herbidospora sp. RD11066]